MTEKQASAHALDRLAALPHFRMLPRERLEPLATAARARRYGAGERIFDEGAPARAFFVVASGVVRLFRAREDGRRQVLHHLRAGQAFAEAALLTLRRYPVDAEAVDAGTELIEVPAEAFLKMFRAHEDVAASMVASLSAWLLRLVERIDELSVASAGARLARHLLKLPARGSGAVLTIDLPLTKRALAEHLSITPETLSRLLRRWRERGLIRTAGRSITLLAPDVLEAIADGAGDAE